MEKIVFILWIVIIILSTYFLIQLLRLNMKLHNDIEELKETEELFNVEYKDFEKITFILAPDEQGTIYDKNGNRYRLERENEHRE